MPKVRKKKKEDKPMKRWSKEEISKLQELCLQGVSNKNIAGILGRKVTEIYNKRSQLGITIEKCGGKPKNKKAVKTVKEKKNGMSGSVKKGFKGLYNILLIEIAKDETSEKEAKVYSQLAETLINLEEVYDRLIRKG